MKTADARRAARLKTIKSGQIIVDSDGTALDCAIRNISVTGVLVRMDEPAELPETVELVIVSHDISVRAHIAWQNGNEAGLEFAPGTIS